MRTIALRCLASLARGRAALGPLLATPRGGCMLGTPQEQAGAAMAECALLLLSPDTWQRACGAAVGGTLFAGTAELLALVTQSVVRCLALQPPPPRLGLLALACTPALWERCPSLAPAAPQLMLRSLRELGAQPSAQQVADALPGSGAVKGAAAAALLANLLAVGERLALGPAAPPSAPAQQQQQQHQQQQQQQPWQERHAAQVTAVLLALLSLLPERALPRRLQQSQVAAPEAEAADEDEGWLPTHASEASGCGRLPWPAPEALDPWVARQLADLGGDRGTALLRRLVAVQLPATSAAEAAAACPPAAQAWRACQLVWTVLSALPNVQRLRLLLALSVGARLPARVWFNALRPLLRDGDNGGCGGGLGADAWPMPRSSDALGAASSRRGRASAEAAAPPEWCDPGWVLPLVVLSQALGSFLATADASDLPTAIDMSEVYNASAPGLGLLPLLRQTLWQVLVTEGDQPASNPAAEALRRAFASSAGALLGALAERNHRLEFCPPAAFVADGFSPERFHAEAAATQLGVGGAAGGRSRLSSLLRYAPVLVPFEDRVQLLRGAVAVERQAAAEAELAVQLAAGDPWGMGGLLGGGEGRFVPIRRNRLLLDGFERLGRAGGERLRGRVRIQYFDEHGNAEAGIDGGGLFKDFMDELLRQGFDPQLGLFAATPQRELYPSPAAVSCRPDGAALLEFLGAMLGKAVSEGVLLELPLAGFFLKRMAGRRCDLGDLASLDPEVHTHLLALRHYAGDFSDLGLTFTITEEAMGALREVDLKPGGAGVAVTRANAAEYVHRVADYRLNRATAAAAAAFLRGFYSLVRPAWVALFAPWELAALVSGRDPGGAGLDVADMRAHAAYAGGYHDEGHPVMDAFWAVVASLSPDQQRSLLKFVTGCSRPPLLGFAHLEPRLCIAMAGGVLEDAATERLPTSSACVNTLKLPPYGGPGAERRMREKLLYAIEARAGFDLS
ncbi:MAG: hypothetical protein J3K34DRAFT_417756 [Monoraphidium minutum]|nr:MAG: hypothetical protein J3K34DRAFT_417756 [Monoraphidium minutum]